MEPSLISELSVSVTPHHYRETVTSGKILVTNSAFSFSARHPVLELAMLHLREKYDPACWNCIGPKLITAAVRKHLGARVVQKIPAGADVMFVPLHRSPVSFRLFVILSYSTSE